MKTALRVAAGILALITLGTWLGTGAHRGWTQTEVTEMRIDPITEIEYPEVRRQFVAGVELLGIGLLVAAGLGGLSFWPGRLPAPTRNTTSQSDNT